MFASGSSLLLSSMAIGQTVVGGNVSTNTVWDLAGSPYQLSSTIRVVGGAVLVINPGVEVQVDPGESIIIGDAALGSGELIARGTASRTIRFNDPGGVPGTRDKIRFTNDAVDAVYDASDSYVSGSILEHCEVEHGPVRIENASPRLVSSRFAQSRLFGVIANLDHSQATPSLQVLNCQFRQNGDASGSGGLSSGLGIIGGQDHLIKGCQFRDNLDRGFVHESYDGPGGCEVAHCLFDGNVGGGASFAHCAEIKIDSSEFSSNGTVAAAGRGLDVWECDLLVLTNCTFDSNIAMGSGGGGGLHAEHVDEVLIDDCTFRNNRSAGGGGAVNIQFSRFTIRNSSFLNNRSSSAGGAIWAEGDAGSEIEGSFIAQNRSEHGGGGICLSGNLLMKGTTVQCNTALERGGGLWLPDIGDVTLHGSTAMNEFNSFQGNQSPKGDAICNDNSIGAGPINADFVCWGPFAPVTSPNRIWDGIDNDDLSVVVVTNPVTCAVSDCGQAYTTFCPGDATGAICPCMAQGATGHGCPNTNPNGNGALLLGSGIAEFGSDSFRLSVSSGPPGKVGIILQGTAAFNYPDGNPGIPNASGILCVDPTRRGWAFVTDGTGTATVSDFQGQPFGATAQLLGTTYYQYWYRDPGNPCQNAPASSAAFNFSNAVQVNWE